MKIFYKGKDGGPESNVTGYWLIESKKFFSIAVLRFSDGTREAFHNHAFNAVSMVFGRGLVEETLLSPGVQWHRRLKSFRFFRTSRTCMHRVRSDGVNWAITIRGPWESSWKEFLPGLGRYITLTEGRKIKEENNG